MIADLTEEEKDEKMLDMLFKTEQTWDKSALGIAAINEVSPSILNKA
jgi:uncharacterized protein (DUF4213/DUF364 family)